jgi:hypothetical protein
MNIISFALNPWRGSKGFDSVSEGECYLQEFPEKRTRTQGEVLVESRCVGNNTCRRRSVYHLLQGKGVAERYVFPLALIIPPYPAQRFVSF